MVEKKVSCLNMFCGDHFVPVWDGNMKEVCHLEIEEEHAEHEPQTVNCRPNARYASAIWLLSQGSHTCEITTYSTETLP